MNRSIIRYILASVLEFEALFLILPCLIAIIYKEESFYSFFGVMLLCFVLGWLGRRKKPKMDQFYAREGFVTVSLSWIILSIMGALPFYISGEIPSYVDALFETISGFTTTGSSILSNVEGLSHSALFWRSFTHWIGGMGVLVFILAVLPLAGGYNMYLMRAESTGANVSKFVPRVKESARILYKIYFAITVSVVVCLCIARVPLFDALLLGFGTVGTGGFGVLNDSVASYSMTVQAILTVFMILCGINFNVYYLLKQKKLKEALKCEEMRWYLAIIGASTALIAFQIKGSFHSVFEAVHHALFQVASVITTTGFGTADFDTWPALSKSILVLLMFIGACAGSTGGGIKVSRIVVLCKNIKKELSYIIHPRIVKGIHFEGRVLAKETLKSIQVYLATIVAVFTVSILLISIENHDMVTNFTAVAATLNNIGPGLALVGPTQNFGFFSDFSKIVLMIDMLIGRLELFPMLVLLSPSTWRKNG
ncbi:MAG: TrkH family potassium uptake protein [Roseburia sp.]|nr:TrkH family potassium uptake protein [Roseburia sp.]MCM1277352.1 TrkH family potassium uptake protein [Robinsoniella sp.]